MRNRDENKELQIRRKAIELIVQQGLDGFSMNKVAKAAGVSPATLYIYFKDKEDFISRLATEVAEEMIGHGLKNFDPEMSFETGLHVQWQNRLEYLLKNQHNMEFLEIMRYSGYYEKVTERITEIFGEMMGRFIQNAISRGELLELPFEVYWSVAFAPLYQLIKFHHQGNSYKNETFSLDEVLLKQTFNLVIKALKP